MMKPALLLLPLRRKEKHLVSNGSTGTFPRLANRKRSVLSERSECTRKNEEEEEEILRTLGAQAALRLRNVRVCEVSLDVLKRLAEEMLVHALALVAEAEARAENARGTFEDTK
ncbi:hypothetical protein IAR50_000618 [Cryptococcus sp. DSM 104548]